MFSSLIQGQAAEPKYSQHHQSVSLLTHSHIHTHTLRPQLACDGSFESPALLVRTHFRKQNKTKNNNIAVSIGRNLPIQGADSVLSFQAHCVLPAHHHSSCCVSYNVACSLEPRAGRGSNPDISNIPLAARLAQHLWDGCHLSFLALLRGPGSSEAAFPPLLPPVR